MATECNGCGGCCDPVTSIFTPSDLARLPPDAVDDRTRRWLLHDLERIPRREGLAASPHLTGGGRTTFSMDGRTGQPVVAFSVFYRCRLYDAESRRCTDYDNRPQVCRDFPFEGRQGAELTEWDHAAALPFECSFRADIGQPVTIRSKP